MGLGNLNIVLCLVWKYSDTGATTFLILIEAIVFDDLSNSCNVMLYQNVS